MNINGSTELLAVFGNPVTHSKSPAMHNAVLKALNINAVYVALSSTPENFKNAMLGFSAMHFRGANFTIPFKERLLEFADEVSPISKFTGSANTLFWKNGKLHATTTDPYGAIKNMEEAGVSPYKKSIAILGNGGAAKALAFALLEQKADVTIVCRNLERGKALSDRLKTVFFENAPKVLTFDAFDSTKPDIILNATPLGMHPNVSDTPLLNAMFRKDQLVYDIIYTPKETRLLCEAKAQGVRILNGEGMLIHQGLASFKLWFPKETENVDDAFLVNTMRQAIL